MKSPHSLGMNRTGIAMSPIETAAMLKPSETPAPPPGDANTVLAFRGSFFQEAEPIGTVPLPGSLKGIASTALHKLKGDRPEVFLDKLGERIAFERTGTRLYELLLNKVKFSPEGELPAGAEARLAAIRADELHHFHLTTTVMKNMGGDPTAMTPGADVAGVMSMGLVKILANPSTTLLQSLEAILIAELTDNDAWPLLIELAAEQNLDQVVEDFRRAELAEQRHLREVRALVSQILFNRQGVLH